MKDQECPLKADHQS